LSLIFGQEHIAEAKKNAEIPCFHPQGHIVRQLQGTFDMAASGLACFNM